MIPSKPSNLPVRILVVDDEDSTRTVLLRALNLLGYQSEGAGNGRQALERLRSAPFDLMLLDLRMPEMDGVQVMDVVRREYPTLSVIVLTAHATLDSAITAVKAGAVDYLLKPQSISDIQAAIQRALKRTSAERQRQHLIDVIGGALHALQTEDENTFTLPHLPAQNANNNITFDPELRRLTIRTETRPATLEVELTSHQADILSYMFQHPQKALTSQEIANKALGYNDLSEIEAERIVRPHILRLRRKIEIDPANPRLIRSVRGKGYLFSPE